MTKAELIAQAKAKKAELAETAAKSVLDGDVMNITNADDTAGNPKIVPNGTVVDDGKTNNLPGVDGGQLPTQAGVEKMVAGEEGPIVPADSDGISKNGGEDATLMSQDGIEKERAKQNKGMQDVINVSSRKVEENSEVQAELLLKLHEAAEREEGYKAQIQKINTLCEKALAAQENELTQEHAKEMNAIFETVIAEGEKMERELTEAAVKNEKLYTSAQKLAESSTRLNKILLEAVKKAQPEVVMTRYTTPTRRIAEMMSK